MIVVDANVLIAHFNSHDSNHDRAEAALIGAVEHPLAASSLTLAEVLVGPARAGRLDAAVAGLAAMDIEEIPMTAGSAARLAGLRATTGLKLPDCAVLLAAQVVQADGLLTFDDQLNRRAQDLGFVWPTEEPAPTA